MTLGLRDTRTRRRRQLRWRIFKIVLFLGFLAVAGGMAYQSGSLIANQKVLTMEKRIDELEKDLESIRQENDQLNLLTSSAKQGEAEWRKRYEAEIPQGEAKTLYDQMVGKLEGGVEPDRLAFIIGATANKRNCDDAPVAKRFIVQTAFTTGANDSVSFAKKALTVTARGEASTNQTGNPEAWYDPAKPISLRFTEIGGKSSEFEGTMPLHQSVVIGGSEYRFTAIPGKRGFIEISADRCDFP